MDWQQKIYIYCERGQDPTFWAEPLNALSNGAFVLAALIAAGLVIERSRTEGRALVFEGLLVALVATIGVGSFLFHTYATRWAQFADIIPIGIFMLVYLTYVLRKFAGAPWLLVAAGVPVFYFAMQYAASIECRPALMPITAAAGARCLNGSLAYSPALITLGLLAAAVSVRRHPAAPYLVAATVVFTASMALRTLDIEICDRTRLFGPALGSHFLWHLFNAVTLYLLLFAVIRHGRAPRNSVA